MLPVYLGFCNGYELGLKPKDSVAAVGNIQLNEKGVSCGLFVSTLFCLICVAPQKLIREHFRNICLCICLFSHKQCTSHACGSIRCVQKIFLLPTYCFISRESLQKEVLVESALARTCETSKSSNFRPVNSFNCTFIKKNDFQSSNVAAL